MTFQKILCPIDFSPGSRRAERVAIRIANEAGAELVLAHAWHVPPVAFAGEHVFASGVMEELERSARLALDEAAREATAHGAQRLTTKLLGGMPRHEIKKLLEHDPAFDLVVMGTHGRTGLARILLGSVAESIVRHAPCSVLAVRPDGEPGPFTRVLCPVDFTDDSRHAAELAAELARPEGELALLHVIEPPAVYGSGQRALELLGDLERSSTEHLDRWAARLADRAAAAPVTKRSRIGFPGAEILKALEERPGFDLVVMGSHGRLGLERILLGSVAEKIVRHASCPVLVARKR